MSRDNLKILIMIGGETWQQDSNRCAMFRDDRAGESIAEDIRRFVKWCGCVVIIRYEKSEDGHEPIRSSLFAYQRGFNPTKMGWFITIDTGKGFEVYYYRGIGWRLVRSFGENSDLTSLTSCCSDFPTCLNEFCQFWLDLKIGIWRYFGWGTNGEARTLE